LTRCTRSDRSGCHRWCWASSPGADPYRPFTRTPRRLVRLASPTCP
jgi:hypothetical protein